MRALGLGSASCVSGLGLGLGPTRARDVRFRPVSRARSFLREEACDNLRRSAASVDDINPALPLIRKYTIIP